jgi:hypothetical protein
MNRYFQYLPIRALGITLCLTLAVVSLHFLPETWTILANSLGRMFDSVASSEAQSLGLFSAISNSLYFIMTVASFGLLVIAFGSYLLSATGLAYLVIFLKGNALTAWQSIAFICLLPFLLSIVLVFGLLLDGIAFMIVLVPIALLKIGVMADYCSPRERSNLLHQEERKKENSTMNDINMAESEIDMNISADSPHSAYASACDDEGSGTPS